MGLKLSLAKLFKMYDLNFTCLPIPCFYSLDNIPEAHILAGVKNSLDQINDHWIEMKEDPSKLDELLYGKSFLSSLNSCTFETFNLANQPVGISLT